MNRRRQLSENPAVEPAGLAEAELAETGNYPFPDDGAQDDVEQTTLPQYDEDLVDGAGLDPADVDAGDEP
jgi:hypothetical protein